MVIYRTGVQLKNLLLMTSKTIKVSYNKIYTSKRVYTRTFRSIKIHNVVETVI